MGRAGRWSRLRLRHLRVGRDAQPPQPRAGVHVAARRPRGRSLPTRCAVGWALRRAVRALHRRRVRNVPGDAVLGDARRRVRDRHGDHLHARAEARADRSLSRAVVACVPHRARRCRAVPVGRTCASRSTRHQRRRLRARSRQPDRPDAGDGPAAVVAAPPGRAAGRRQPHRAARLPRARASRDRALRALGTAPSAVCPSAGCDDRRRDGRRARLAPRRGGAPHEAAAAVDAGRQPAAGRPCAAHPGSRDRLARARGDRRALPLPRRAACAGSSSS